MKLRYAVVPALTAAILSVLYGPAVQEIDARSRVVNADSASKVPGLYIVTLKDSNASRVDVRRAAHDLARRHGAEIQYVYTDALHGFSARMDAGEAERVASDGTVAHVEQAVRIHGTATQADPPSWGLGQIDNKPADNTYTYPNAGKGVTVYVFDNHIRVAHKTFEGRAVKGVDTIREGNCLEQVHQPHGTFVAGLVGGKEYGVAKKVSIVSVKVLNCLLSGDTANVVKGVDWMMKHLQKPAVVNASFSTGAGAKAPAMVKAIKNSTAAGVIWVVAAGNDNDGACKYLPAKMERVITVAATRKNHMEAGYSNHGKCVDIYAPGTDVVSSDDYTNTAQHTWSGTSFASPHVAGAVAIYLKAHPNATFDRVKTAIQNGSRKGFVENIGPGSPNRFLNVQKLRNQ